MKTYLIKNGPAYFVDGENFYNVYSFSQNLATKFNSRESAADKMEKIANWPNDKLQLMEIK